MIAASNSQLSTNDLVSRVKHSLAKLSYRQLDGVDCTVESDDRVTLSGRLRSYYLKQIAQTIAIKVPGVKSVTNEITVKE